jgi:hypothetical protein
MIKVCLKIHICPIIWHGGSTEFHTKLFGLWTLHRYNLVEQKNLKNAFWPQISSAIHGNDR